MDIVEAIRSPKLFKPVFKDLKTWSAWLVLLRALFALELGKRDLSVYQKVHFKE